MSSACIYFDEWLPDKITGSLYQISARAFQEKYGQIRDNNLFFYLETARNKEQKKNINLILIKYLGIFYISTSPAKYCVHLGIFFLQIFCKKKKYKYNIPVPNNTRGY